MVRYVDPELDPELPKRQCQAVGERLARWREKNAALRGSEAFEAAREVALRRLDRHSCTEEELRTAIVTRGFSQDLAQQVVCRLVEVGLVNDRHYAEAFVRDRFSLSGKTGRALSQDLQRRGISQELIHQALDQIGDEDQEERARELVRKKIATFHGVSRDTAYRRLTSLLARKGYSAHICVSVVSEILTSYEEEE